MTCPAKVRPFPNETEVACELKGAHGVHQGVIRDYAWPGSRTQIRWDNGHRRNFTGEWMECPQAGCVLPAGHPRRHAE